MYFVLQNIVLIWESQAVDVRELSLQKSESWIIGKDCKNFVFNLLVIPLALIVNSSNSSENFQHRC